jgi:hypothetical protein
MGGINWGDGAVFTACFGEVLPFVDVVAEDTVIPWNTIFWFMLASTIYRCYKRIIYQSMQSRTIILDA